MDSIMLWTGVLGWTKRGRQKEGSGRLLVFSAFWSQMLQNQPLQAPAVLTRTTFSTMLSHNGLYSQNVNSHKPTRPSSPHVPSFLSFYWVVRYNKEKCNWLKLLLFLLLYLFIGFSLSLLSHSCKLYLLEWSSRSLNTTDYGVSTFCASFLVPCQLPRCVQSSRPG